MNKKITGILMTVALLLIAAAGIGKANAYFTSYTNAAGAQTLKLGDVTEIEEKMDKNRTLVVIKNNDNSDQPVYVRVMAFGPADVPLTCSGTNWVDGGDGYWYYNDGTNDIAVQPGESTAEFVAEIEFPEADKDSKDFNVVVVYETTLSDWSPDNVISSQ